MLAWEMAYQPALLPSQERLFIKGAGNEKWHPTLPAARGSLPLREGRFSSWGGPAMKKPLTGSGFFAETDRNYFLSLPSWGRALALLTLSRPALE